MADFYSEMGKAQADGISSTPDLGTAAIADSIRQSYTQPPKTDMYAPPKDFNPNNGLFFNDELQTTEKQSFTQKNYNVEDAYATLHDGSMVRRYDEYKVGRDNAEYAAQTQSTGEKWAHGAEKFAGKVALGIVGNTVGVVEGIHQWAAQGSFRASYDNQFNNYLDDLNEKLDYKLPNYYSKAEQSGDWYKQAVGLQEGGANFWADKVLGGAAFTVSAIASEAIWGYATGGAGTASVTARLGMQAERLFGAEAGIAKTLKAMSKAKAIVAEPAMLTYANKMLPVALATKLGKAGEFLNTARYMYTSAGFESGMEARTYIREMKDGFQSDFEAKNNRPPTEEETKDFNENLTDSANALYGFNMAIVGSSNLMTIGRLADIKNPLVGTSKWANSKLFGIGLEEVEGKMIAKTATKLQNVAKYAWGIGESPLMEGVFEEGMQSVGSNTAKNWIQSKYDPKYAKNTLDISTAFTQGLSNTYGTKKGMEEIGIGMLIGLISGTGTNLYKYKSLKGEVLNAEKQNKNLENFYNSYYSPNKVAETMAYSGRVQAANVGADTAQKKGDFVGGELNRQSAIIAQLSQAHNLDYLDETVKQTEVAINNIGNDLLMKEYGVDEQGAKDIKEKLIEEHKSTAKVYEKYRNFAEYYIGKNLSKEEQAKAGTLGVSDIKDAIAYELTLGEKVHGFSQDLLTAIKEETGRTVLGTEMSGALSIEDILLKAGKETRKEAQGKEKQIVTLDRQREALEREYKEVEKTMFNTVEPEARKKFLNKTDSIRNEIKDIEGQIESLTKDYSLLIKTANMKNPFGKNVDDIMISSQSVKNRIRTLNQIKELAGELGKTDPQKGLKLQKLLNEYGKSITAFTRYADLSRQLSDPKLGLRGKRNIITEIRSDKTPTAITVEFLEGLQKSMGSDTVIDQAANVVEGQGFVQDILNKKEAPEDGATIEGPTIEEVEIEKDKKIKEITEEYDAKINELYKTPTEPIAQPAAANWGKDLSKVKEELNKLGTKEEKLQWLSDNGYLEAFVQDGKTSNYLRTATNRVVVKIKIGDIVIPFYISTGQGLKEDVETNKWYVFFGQGENGWFNKTSGDDINSQYGVKTFQDIAEVLNEVGSIREEYAVHTLEGGVYMDLKFTGEAENQLNKVIDFITPIQPTNSPDGPKASPEQIDQLNKNIQEVKDRVAAELEKEPTATVDKSRSPKNIDIERRNLEREKEDAIDEVKRQGTEKIKRVTIREYIRDLIKNSPYLFEYYGEDTPVMMTEEEMNEFEDLARRAIEDPKIDNKTIAFKSPYTWNRLTPTTRPSLTKAEIKRLQELNEKLANWRLLETYGSSDGVSITDMLIQDLLIKRTVEPVDNTQTSNEDFHKVNQEKDPKVDEEGKAVRKSEILQNVEKVVARKAKNGFYISHLTLPGLIDRLATLTDEVIYTEVDEKGKVIPGSDKKISADDIINNNKLNARFLLTFEDGSTATVRVTRGGQIVLKNSEAEAVLNDARLKFLQGGELNTSNYGDIYDLEGGEGHKLDSDFKDVLDYSPEEIYNAKPGSIIKFEVDIEDSYNQEIIQAFREVEAEFGTDSKEYQDAANYLRDQLKINTLDKAGNRVGMLKANYDIAGDNAAFLLIRQEAFKKATNPKGNTKLILDIESSVKFIFLGSANYTLEDGKVKLFDPAVDKIVDYGYYDNGRLVLKGGKTETTVKTNFLAKLKNRSNVPVIVFKQGKYLVAFPVALKTKSDIKLGQQFLEKLDGTPGKLDMAKVAIELNNLLEQHNLSPSKYGLYYAGVESETLSDDNGQYSADLNKAIQDLDAIPQVADVRDWMQPEFKREDLAGDILVPFDLNDNPLSSPKIVLDLSSNKVVVYENTEEGPSQADIQSKVESIIEKEVEESLDNSKNDSTFVPEVRKETPRNVTETERQLDEIDNISSEDKEATDEVVKEYNKKQSAKNIVEKKDSSENLKNNKPNFDC
jgi:hypothetical protein